MGDRSKCLASLSLLPCCRGGVPRCLARHIAALTQILATRAVTTTAAIIGRALFVRPAANCAPDNLSLCQRAPAKSAHAFQPASRVRMLSKRNARPSLGHTKWRDASGTPKDARQKWSRCISIDVFHARTHMHGHGNAGADSEKISRTKPTRRARESCDQFPHN